MVTLDIPTANLRAEMIARGLWNATDSRDPAVDFPAIKEAALLATGQVIIDIETVRARQFKVEAIATLFVIPGPRQFIRVSAIGNEEPEAMARALILAWEVRRLIPAD